MSARNRELVTLFLAGLVASTAFAALGPGASGDRPSPAWSMFMAPSSCPRLTASGIRRGRQPGPRAAFPGPGLYRGYSTGADRTATGSRSAASSRSLRRCLATAGSPCATTTGPAIPSA